ncbi:MAG: DUF1573 domain-containing protein [Chitinophagaceae bacterium]|nr:DUF1573 domain-containing protein [Chitinophagaceae bacterium]MBK8953292.1 DUF1573 domain-containing protein [Chitinophagaceae bacterium]
MKKILLFTVIAAGLISCNSADKKDGKIDSMNRAEIEQALRDSALSGTQGAQTGDTANSTTISWIDSTTMDLGKLKKDQQVEVTYRFKNTGDKNLVIENVSAGCGCTIPEKPEKPYAPGEEGVIKARFNGSGSGHISKTVTVVANTKPYRDHVLTFTGDIQESK